MRKISKSLVLMSMAFVLAGSFSAYATSVNANSANSTTKKEKSTNENTVMVYGKITSISADSVTVDIATRKKREKKDGTGNAEITQTERTKPSAEDKFTLTGESKTYNIASANFGKKVDVNETTDNTIEKSKGVAMTYADYKVGDYIRITTDKNTPTVAKRIRNADQGFDKSRLNNKKGNYTGGYKGSYTGKTKAEKQANQ